MINYLMIQMIAEYCILTLMKIKYWLQSSPIRVDDLDELSPLDSEYIPHIGPIEGKLLEGSDGRLYALEILRVTPRDANFIKVTHNF